jgi:hypothetical protein
MNNLFKVTCIRGYHPCLEEGRTYEVAVIVRNGVDYRGECSGYVLHPHTDSNGDRWEYPYVWNTDRFEVTD